MAQQELAVFSTPSYRRMTVFLLFFLMSAAILVLRGPEWTLPIWNVGNDDAMRLVQVRDLLAGQGWFDLMQYRLGPEPGTLMHWSRLVDAPIAALIWAFSAVLSQPMAETAAMILWPLLLTGVILWNLQSCASRLGGTAAGIYALLFGLIMLVTSGKFEPGSLDHHNFQLALTAILINLITDTRPGPTRPFIAGGIVAASLVIGLEAMPVVVTTCAFVALRWGVSGPRARIPTAGYTAGMIFGMTGFYLATLPDFAGTVFRCDAFGADLLLIGSVGAGGLGFLALAAQRTPAGARFALLAALAVAVLGVAWAFAPACLSNPYDQLYPELTEVWLSRIGETKSLAETVHSLDGALSGLFVTPILVSAYAIWLATKGRRPVAGAYFALTILAGYGMVLFQIRGIYFLLILCVVPSAVVLGKLYDLYKSNRTAAYGLLTTLALIVTLPDSWSFAYTRFFPITPTEIGNPAEAEIPASSAEALHRCGAGSAMDALAALPAGLVMASTDLGAILLRETPHRVMTGNFHRAQDGVRAGITLARAGLNDAESVLRGYGIDYVVLCRNDTLPLRISADNPDGLWPRLYDGAAPAYLTPISTADDALVWVYGLTTP